MKESLSYFEAGCWLGYRLLRVTSAALGGLLTVWDAFFGRNLGRGFLPPSWEARARFSQEPGRPEQNDVLWAHAASLGEAAGLLALLRHSSWVGHLLLTAQTATGLERLRGAVSDLERQGCGVRVSVAPWDHVGIARRFLREQGVSQLLLYESELWPGWLEAAAQQGIPAFWVSARCGDKAWQMAQRFPGSARALLKDLTWIQARSPLEADRLRALAPGRVSVGMDAKSLGKPGHPFEVARPRPAGKGLALYCLHRSDWKRIKPQLPSLMALAPICVLPRKPKDFAFFRRELTPLGFALHSQGGGEGHVLVNALGQADLYLRRCQVAYVGGSWNSVGCHAFWEPLRLGLQLVSGPHLHQQQPLADRLQELGLLTVWQQGDLVTTLSQALKGESFEANWQRFWREMQAEQQGALAELRTFLAPGKAIEAVLRLKAELSLP